MAENPTETETVTAMLVAARTGDVAAKERLACAVYGELRQMADAMMQRERPDHTLQPSELVNEAVIRLLDGDALGQKPASCGTAGTGSRLVQRTSQRGILASG